MSMTCSKDEERSTFRVDLKIHDGSSWIEGPVVESVDKAVGQPIEINHVQLVIVAQNDCVSRCQLQIKDAVELLANQTVLLLY